MKLRKILSTHKELERKILELESKYDNQFKLIFEAIKELIQQEGLNKNRPRIGYKIGKGTFRIAFWFSDKFEPIILESDLPENIKDEYKNAKRFNKSRCIYIDILDSNDFNNINKLIGRSIKLCYPLKLK